MSKITDGYKRRTNEQIAELAEQVFRGEMFTSLGLKADQIPMSFMVLNFMDEKYGKWMKKYKITTCYAPMKEALPRVINGYPCFMGANFLDKKDSIRLVRKIQQIEKVMGRVRAGGSINAPTDSPLPEV